MHGLIFRGIERFVRDTYGRAVWIGLTQRLDLGFSEFEAMLTYEAKLAETLIQEIALDLNKDQSDVLEDIGTYLVSHPNVESLRRLLRFSGVSFPDFLHSLDDLPARARLAVDDLILPQLELREHAAQSFSLTVRAPDGMSLRFGHVVVGLLRAMADDYGALVLLDYKGGRNGTEVIDVALLETTFSDGRAFDLGARAEGAPS